jgi:hypothetical protein
MSTAVVEYGRCPHCGQEIRDLPLRPGRDCRCGDLYISHLIVRRGGRGACTRYGCGCTCYAAADDGE